MWILQKPSKESVEADLKVVKKWPIPNDKDIAMIATVYDEYDKNSGLVKIRVSKKLSTIIRCAYSRTYQGGSLYSIRKDLTQNWCVYCSLSQADTLDHVYDKHTYGHLAILRYNLVPACSLCNEMKGRKDGSLFLHPYYNPRLNNVEFLKAKASVSDGIPCVTCSIDSSSLTENESRQIQFQWETFKLEDRVRKGANSFLADLLASSVGKEPDWKLLAEIQTYRYGLNDWRISAIRALENCPDITPDIIINLLKVKANNNAYPSTPVF